MRTLWRSTAYLFRQFPILWLPLAIADVITFGLNWTERLLHHNLVVHLVSWLNQSHSVLSSTPVYAGPSPFTTTVVVILTAPITWATYFLSTVLYTSAMLVTGALLANLTENAPLHLRSAASTLGPSGRRIMVFSLKLCALFAASMLIFAPLLFGAMQLQRFLETTPSLTLTFQLELQKADLLGYIAGLPAVIVVAWIIAPTALRLLRPPDSIPTSQEKKTARVAALTVVGIAFTLEFFVPRIATSLLQELATPSSLLIYAARAITSLISAIPYIFLYIALYLIANPDSTLASTHEIPLDLPSLPESPPPSIAE